MGGAILRTPGRYILQVMVPTLLAFALRWGVTGTLLLAFGISPSLETLLRVNVSHGLARTVQVTPGGFGTTQAFDLVALRGIAPVEVITAYSLSQAAILLLFNIAFGLVALTWAFGWDRTARLMRLPGRRADARRPVVTQASSVAAVLVATYPSRSVRARQPASLKGSLVPRPLSLLDLTPIVAGSSAGEAVRTSVELAVLADQLGYHRVWYAEHHNSPGLASGAPEIMIEHVASRTSRAAGGSRRRDAAEPRSAEDRRDVPAVGSASPWTDRPGTGTRARHRHHHRIRHAPLRRGDDCRRLPRVARRAPGLRRPGLPRRSPLSHDPAGTGRYQAAPVVATGVE